MSYNYGPNYMAMIQALQQGGIATTEAAKSARQTRGLGVSPNISRLGEVIDPIKSKGGTSPQGAILARFEKVQKDNESLRERMKELGIEQDPVTKDLGMSGRSGNTAVGVVDFDPDMIDIAMGALSDVESRGSGGYKAVGSVVKKGMYKGQRAYGKYQVMEGNIGPWTEKYYGKRLSKEEFLANPEAQDTVVENLLLSNWEKYGSIEDAVSVWFTGRPFKKAQTAGASDDDIGIPEYMDRWRSNYNRRYNESLGGEL